MTRLPDFRLETYFSRWEFTARHHLTASDVQTMTLSELLALADGQDRTAFETLALGYTATYGDPALREVIAQMYEQADAADVICFAGAEEALYLAMNVLLDAGDHAVVVTPNYQAAETIPLALCEVSGVPLAPHRDWALDLDQIKAAIRPNTRVVSVNFPNNPTGKVISAADFTELARLCDEHGIHLFSDEVYRGLERDPARTLPQAADLSARALWLNVTSKSLGLPGLRIGWITCRDRALRGPTGGRNVGVAGPDQGGDSMTELDSTEDRPVISSVVIASGKNEPSHGYWAFVAEDLGIRVPAAGREAFWLKELVRCFEVYGRGVRPA